MRTARHLPGLTMGYQPKLADLRPLPLVERKARLQRLLRRRANHLITEALAIEGRGKALFAAVEEHDLEGIVAKRKADPYRRGVKWFKVLNAAYSQREGRHELFDGDPRHQSRDPILRAIRQFG